MMVDSGVIRQGKAAHFALTRRYSMMVDNGIIRQMFVEKSAGDVGVSSGEHMLKVSTLNRDMKCLCSLEELAHKACSSRGLAHMRGITMLCIPKHSLKGFPTQRCGQE